MELSVIKKDGAIEVKLEDAEKIYILNQEELRDELNWCLSIFHDKLILNLEGIRFIDTTGFRLLLELKHLYQNLGKDFEIVNISEELAELFELVKVNKLFGSESFEDDLEKVAA
jgi:anti-anti-sigma factor